MKYLNDAWDNSSNYSDEEDSEEYDIKLSNEETSIEYCITLCSSHFSYLLFTVCACSDNHEPISHYPFMHNGLLYHPLFIKVCIGNGLFSLKVAGFLRWFKTQI